MKAYSSSLFPNQRRNPFRAWTMAGVSLAALALFSCGKPQTVPGSTASVSGLARDALEIAEREFAKVVLRKGQDLYVLAYNAADLELPDREALGDQWGILYWISLGHGPAEAEGESETGFAMMNPFQAMLDEYEGGKPAGLAILESLQGSWKRAGIMPRVLYSAELFQCAQMRHVVEPFPVTEADRRNGIRWKGRVRFTYTTQRRASIVGDIGEIAESPRWSEWEAGPEGGWDFLTVALTLREGDWEVATSPNLGPPDLLGKTETIAVETVGVRNVLGMTAPDPETRVTAHVVRTGLPLSNGRYYSKPNFGDLPK